MKVHKQKLQMHMKAVYGIWPGIPWGTFSAGNSVLFPLFGRSFQRNSCLCHSTKSDWTDVWWNVYDVYSGSNDHTTKFWCRNRPAESLHDNRHGNAHSQGEDTDS